MLLNYSNRFIEASYHNRLNSVTIKGPTIITNIGDKACDIKSVGNPHLDPGYSTILETAEISGEHLVLHDVLSDVDLGSVMLFPEWQTVAQVFPDAGLPPDTPLWRSPQVSVGCFKLDLSLPLGGAFGARLGARHYELMLNLWYAPPRTNCLIHNTHSFFELHTQIAGDGRMQKFHSNAPADLYEDVLLRPGQTHGSFASSADGVNFVYPWHQYYSDTDCVWLAIEYHPA